MIYFSDFSAAGGGGGGATISFVGSKVVEASSSSQWTAISLADLKDESNSNATLQEGDTVFVGVVESTSKVDRATADMQPFGFDILHDAYFEDATGGSVNTLIGYRFMSTSPDANIYVPPRGAHGGVKLYAIFALRGIDPTAIIDVAVTSAGAENSGTADCPSITPSTAGSWIMAWGFGQINGNAADYTLPSGMSSTTNHFRTLSTTSAVYDATIGVALKTDWASGAYDPAAFGGGMSGADSCWQGVTLAVRPDQQTYPSSLTGSYDTLTIASGEVSSNLSDFPVMVDLSDLSAGFWAAVDADGGNIRVTNSDGSVILPLDIASINTGTETGRAYFRADLLSGSNNVFRIYYDTGLSLVDADHRHGSRMVWGGRYQIAIDGFSNANRAWSGAMTLAGDAAFSSGAINFDGTNDAAYLPVFNPATALSMLAVGYLATGGGTHKGVAGYASSWSTSPNRINLNVRDTGKWSTWNNTNSWFESSITATFDADFTAALVHDGGTAREVFANGASGGSNASAVAIYTATGPVFMLGAEDSTIGEEMNGNISLALFTDRAMSAAEIAAIHDNWRTAFYTIS